MRSFSLMAFVLVTGCVSDQSCPPGGDTIINIQFPSETDSDTDSADSEIDTGQELSAYTCTPFNAGEQDPKYIMMASLPTVYYVDPDCFRYTFPLSQVFFTWEDSYEVVATVPDKDVAALVLGGNMPFKPGVVLVKIQSDPKVYAVTENPDSAYNPILRWIESEQLATDIYGPAWNQYVVDVPYVFFTDYVIGEPVDEVTDLPEVDLNMMKTRDQLGM